ncbi:hypothetical protein [Rhodosalinus sp.]|uniref:hypothetical protein n=1 Tax=Rhodosalinus sp. TaxID=2047741 RepID=UPI00397CD1F1
MMKRHETRGAGQTISAMTFACAGAVFASAALGGEHGVLASAVLALSSAACFAAVLGTTLAKRLTGRRKR